jgi:predicted ThiF/HesA family dinucleotide-utilizing enzyme
VGTWSKAEENERRARARRTAWMLGLVAIGFYVAFIVMSVSRAG